MPSYAALRETNIFTPWEKELYVEIEMKGIARSLASEGSTLFDHIIEVYFRLTKTMPHSNLDDFISCIEIKEFSQKLHYIKVRIRKNNTLPGSARSKTSYTSTPCFDIL